MRRRVCRVGLRRWLMLLLSSLVLCMPTLASAQSSADDLARRHFESGVAYLEESDYDNALKAFEKSYELSKRPEILLNIATVNERKGDLSAAVTALKQYLEAAPNAPNAATIQNRIQNLEKRVSEQSTPAPSPAPAPPAAGTPPPAPPPSTPTTQPPPAETQRPNRIPAYIAFGVGGAATIGAVVTGLIASSDHSELESTCAPQCKESDVSKARTMAVTNTILIGVAVVGVGVGVTLLLIEPSSDSAHAKALPEVRIATNGVSATARAAWRF